MFGVICTAAWRIRQGFNCLSICFDGDFPVLGWPCMVRTASRRLDEVLLGMGARVIDYARVWVGGVGYREGHVMGFGVAVF